METVTKYSISQPPNEKSWCRIKEDTPIHHLRALVKVQEKLDNQRGV